MEPLFWSTIIAVIIYAIISAVFHEEPPQPLVVTSDTLSENLNTRSSRFISTSATRLHYELRNAMVRGYSHESINFNDYFDQYLASHICGRNDRTRTIKCKNKHLN